MKKRQSKRGPKNGVPDSQVASDTERTDVAEPAIPGEDATSIDPVDTVADNSNEAGVDSAEMAVVDEADRDGVVDGVVDEVVGEPVDEGTHDETEKVIASADESPEMPEAGDTAEMSADDPDATVAETVDGAASPSEPAVDSGEDVDAADELGAPAEAGRLESIIMSLLFAADRPLTVADLKRLLGEREPKRISESLESLRERYAESGIQLVALAGGWQLRTHPVNGPWVAKLVAGRPQRLSRALMETLAIVAYRQPITRPEIDEIRGVDCGPVLRTLLDRGLVRVIGKKEEVGRPILYGTTPEFLKTFSLKDLTELPTLREFHELGADEKAQVEAKTGGRTAADNLVAPDAPMPAVEELRAPDAAEEDALLGELDRAADAAGRAARAPIDPAASAAESASETEEGAGASASAAPNGDN